MPLLDPYYLAVMGVLGASSKRRALASPPPVLLVLRPLFHSSAHSCTANLKLPLLVSPLDYHHDRHSISDYHCLNADSAFHPPTLCAVLGMAR